MATKKTTKAATPTTTAEDLEHGTPQKAHRLAPQKTARIVKMVPRDNSKREKLIARKLGGHYRVIHSHIAVPLPEAQWRKPDGDRIEGAPTFVYAMPGDIVEFDHYEAALYLDGDLIEPLDAKPSRVGKVWQPPPAKPYPYLSEAAAEPPPAADTNLYGEGVGQ